MRAAVLWVALALCWSGAAGAKPRKAGKAPKPAEPPKTLYVQVSGLNLREKAKASAKVLKQVPIASACLVLEKRAAGWARLDCGGIKGFSKLELLGERKPELGPLLEQARSAQLTATDRLNYALRAATLVPGQAEALKLAGQLFFEAELESLAATRKKVSPAVRQVAVACPGHEVAPCLEKLENDQADFARVQLRGDDAIHMREMHDYADWQVEAGKVVWTDDKHTAFTFNVENTYHAPPMAALFTAVEGKPAPDAAHTKPTYVEPKAEPEPEYEGPPISDDDVDALVKDCSASVGTACEVALFQACVESDQLDPCEQTMSSCSDSCMSTCYSCKKDCTATCGGCAAGCAAGPSHDACVRACALKAARCLIPCGEDARSCADDCGRDLGRCRGH